ncbi:defender against death DAD protein [Neoconidiobolus thromboides FSU 785]|nr:defender against death DAD protein [Neoconidiobolus thromboides FSU 785]
MGKQEGDTTITTGQVNLNEIVSKVWESYQKSTTNNLKLIDVYMMFILLTGILQFIYLLLAGTFPYNAFLAGFISTVGSFTLAANLRIQVNPKNSEFTHISPMRAFGDFIFCNIILLFFVTNFLG